jgi:hypothetical protein
MGAVTFVDQTQTAGSFRLGRHQLHDQESRDFPAVMLLPDRSRPPQRTVMHEQHLPPLDQGQVGSCTANAALGVLCSGIFWRGIPYTEADALALYELETRIDNHQIPGMYPPDDTGSTGLWSMKALRQKGIVHSYHHAFATRTVLQLLEYYPVSVGVPWYNSMFDPDPQHRIPTDPSSGVAGGHQVALVGIDVETKLVRVRNSWGTAWGDGGYAWLSWTDLAVLLSDGGDAVVPVQT